MEHELSYFLVIIISVSFKENFLSTIETKETFNRSSLYESIFLIW